MNWYGPIEPGLNAYIYGVDGREISRKAIQTQTTLFESSQNMADQLQLLVVKNGEGETIFQQKIIVRQK